jgi:hypothetical protein
MIMPVYKRLVDAIRAVDPDHLIFLEGNRYSLDFHMFDEPWPLVVYTNHDYALPGFIDGGPYPGISRGQYVDKRVVEETFLQRSQYMLKHNVPIWVGEFGPVYTGRSEADAMRYQLLQDQLEIYARHRTHWAIWTYKDIGLQGVVYADPDSKWVKRIEPILECQERRHMSSKHRFEMSPHYHNPCPLVGALRMRCHRLKTRLAWAHASDRRCPASVAASPHVFAQDTPSVVGSPHVDRPPNRLRRAGGAERCRWAGDGTVHCSKKHFVDFQMFIQTVLVPEAQRRRVQTVVLIVDNGPTHAPKQLERWLQEQAREHARGSNFQVYWLPKNASWLDQLEIWFSRLQHKLLQPNHFTSTTALEQAIYNFIAYSNRMARPIAWSYTVEKLEQKLGSHL